MGVVVMNVTSVAFVGKYLATGMPLHRPQWMQFVALGCCAIFLENASTALLFFKIG